MSRTANAGHTSSKAPLFVELVAVSLRRSGRWAFGYLWYSNSSRAAAIASWQVRLALQAEVEGVRGQMGEEQKVANRKVQALNARLQQLEDKHAQLGAKLQAAEKVRVTTCRIKEQCEDLLGSPGAKGGDAPGLLRGKPCCAWPKTVSLELQKAEEARGPTWGACGAHHSEGLAANLQWWRLSFSAERALRCTRGHGACQVCRQQGS